MILKALSDYEKAIEIDPSIADAYCSRASLRRHVQMGSSVTQARRSMMLGQR